MRKSFQQQEKETRLQHKHSCVAIYDWINERSDRLSYYFTSTIARSMGQQEDTIQKLIDESGQSISSMLKELHDKVITLDLNNKDLAIDETIKKLFDATKGVERLLKGRWVKDLLKKH